LNAEGPLTTDETGTVTTSLFTANSEYGLVTISADAGLGSTADFTLENLTWHLYVATTGSDANTCKTPADPCATINGAISIANPEDVIYVAEGIYTGSGLAVVTIQKSLFLSGGWDSTFTTRTGYATINGENARRGIDISGTYTIDLSYFDIRNAKGPGISHYQSNLTVTHSSIHDNYNDGNSGGGIRSDSGALYISHSTINNNYAQSGGGIYSSSVTELNFVTVSNNSAKYGGGLYRYDGTRAFTVKNSILENNTASVSDPDCRLYPVTEAVSLGYNIVRTTCGPVQPTDQFNTDAKLGLFLPAQGYSPLYPDSPAIDNSDNTCGNEDQRGVASVDIPGKGVDGEVRCDAGAFEFIRNDGTPASVWVVDGNDQRTPPNNPFNEPLTAVVLDDQGNPVSGVDITFSAPASGANATFQATGNISEGPLTTNAVGTVTSSTVTANAIPGGYSVTANGGTAGITTFTLTNAAWYVSPSGNDSNNCTSIAEPCATINGARAKAVSGDTIFITADVYTGTGTEVVLADKPIHLSGGWNAAFDTQTGYTTVDGEDARQGIVIEKEYVNTAILVIIDHFIVRNGYLGFGNGGGGIDNELETLELSDSILEENYASSGGGLFTSGSSSLTHVIIRNNRAGSGGGIASSSPMTIENSFITGNYAESAGGGVHNGSALTITNTSIVENEALVNGGGLYTNTYHYSEDLVILNNVTLTGNIAGDRGGGISNDRASYLVIQPEIRNSIVAGNEASLSFDCVGTFIFKYSLIQDTAYCFGATAATNLTGMDPQLTGFLPSEGYAPLRATSPARNMGDPVTPGSGGTACVASDQRGVSRADARCDMGAFEYTTPGSAARIVPITYGMRTPPNSTFDHPLQAIVLDAVGSPVSGGMSLTFTAPSGGGPSGFFANLSNTEDVTVNSDGIATSSAFTANGQFGDYEVVASSSGLALGEIPLSNFAWFVRTDGDDSNNCTSPATACLTIEEALKKANTDDSIYFAEGRYFVPDHFTTITRRVKIVGSWTTDFLTRGKPTILDGHGIHSVLSNSAKNTLIKRIKIENCADGLSNYGTITLDQVAIIGCTGSGIYNGNGINYASMTILNSTIHGNQMGGLHVLSGDVMVNNSTIAYNRQTDSSGSGGGIKNWGPGTVAISNTIVAYNSAYEGPDCYVYAPEGGKLISAGYNIISNTTGCAINAKTGDKFNVDPNLLPLIPLGYHPLRTTSLAIGRGNPATCTSQDQRDLDRLTNAKCDIGAYEYQAPGAAVELLAINPEVRRTGINSPFNNPLQAVVLDVFGTPVSGVEVNFSAPASGPSGTFQAGGGIAESLTTDAYGYAATSVFTANGEYGDYMLLAESPGLPGPVNYQIHNGAWLVVPVTGNDDNDCLSIATPCLSMEGVLKKQVFTNGDTVWTAAGNISSGTMTYIKKSAVFVGGWDTTFTTKGGASSIRAYYINQGDLSFTNYILGSQISNSGRLVLENSSIVGGIVDNGYTGTTILSNVTVTGNGDIESPIYNNGGTIYVFSSTITKNKARYAGGIYNNPYSNGVVYLKDTILAGNTATLATEKKTYDCLGKFISLGHNIIGTIGIYTTGTYNECRVTALENDIIGDNAHPYLASSVINMTVAKDPLSGQYYHALKLSGPAIDAGNEVLPGSGGNACSATDQLGIRRPQGARCDIGAVEYKFDSYPTDSLLVTYTARNTTSLPGTQLCESNNSTCSSTDTQAKSAHKYAFSAYNQYKLWHRRNSLDGNGLQIMSAVHYGSYTNAFWNGYMLVFGDGFAAADDVVAHEFTHGVTQYESNLFYWYQSGAINESFSDLWGEAVDQANRLGNDTAGVKWLIGEDITSLGAIRSMSNPPAYGDPDSITSSYYCKSGDCLDDNGGVYTNSGVNNKAAYLMVNGGTFNSRTVTALGWLKTLAIYYEAQTNLLTSGSDYLDLYNSLYQACLNKVGANGIVSADCLEVRDATLAVKMNLQPAANFNPDVPYCPSGIVRAAPDLFYDNFETGTDGWTLGKLSGQSAWGLSGRNAASGVASLWADDSYDKADSFAATNGILLPVGSKPYLHFTHAYNFETAGVAYYDGGVLEYSVNDGGTWADAKALYSAGQNYKAPIVGGFGNPLQGRSAFVGESHGYVDSRYNLTTLAGKTIRFRWRMGTDSAGKSTGWFVDDVRIYLCVGIPSVPTLLLPANNAQFVNLTPTFDWSDSTPDLHHYELQLATDSAFTQNLVSYNNILVSNYTPATDLNAGTQYYWHVRAFNAAGKASAWSAVWSFGTTP
jgi:Zn-dependent metalloprotease